MTKVAVFRGLSGSESMPYLAVSGRNQGMGRTAGEALDALASQLTHEEASTLVVVREMGPDRFFTAEERSRPEELTAANREASARNSRLAPERRAELERLIDDEVRAAGERAKAATRHE